jgi:hypothetical protein
VGTSAIALTQDRHQVLTTIGKPHDADIVVICLFIPANLRKHLGVWRTFGQAKSVHGRLVKHGVTQKISASITQVRFGGDKLEYEVDVRSAGS